MRLMEQVALTYYSLMVVAVAMPLNYALNWAQEAHNTQAQHERPMLFVYLCFIAMPTYFLMKCQSILKINIYHFFHSPDWMFEDVLDDADWNLLFDPGRADRLD